MQSSVAVGWQLPRWAQFDPEKPAADGIRLGDESTQYWKAGIKIRAAAAPCRGIVGTVPVPMDWPEQTVTIAKEELSPQVREATYRTIQGSVKQLVLTISQLNPLEAASAVVTFEVKRRAILPPEDPSQYVVPERPSREIRQYLAPESVYRNAECSDPLAAKELFDQKQTAWEQVEVLYDWVREHVEYRDGKLKGALAAMRDGDGDCEEFTSLFIAFCRVNGVPARTVWIPGHCYPEFYLENTEGKGRWFPCQAAGTRDFGGMAEFRPILQKGDNFRVPEQKAPQRYVAELLKIQSLRGGGEPQHQFIGEDRGRALKWLATGCGGG